MTPKGVEVHEPDPTDLTLPVDERRELIGWAAECIHRLPRRGTGL